MSIDKMTLDLVGEYVKQNNIKLLEAAGTPAVSTEENNAIVKKSDGIYAEDLSDKVRELDNRSVIAETNNYCKLLMSNNQVAVLNDIIKYDKVVYSNNMEYNLSNYTIHLKAGRTYDLRCTILTGLVSGATAVRFFNKTTNEFIGNIFKSVSPNYNATECPNSSYSELYECKSDCDVCVQIVAMVGSQTIYNTVSIFEVAEVGRTIILDPVVYAQDHEINYYEFGMTANYNVAATNNGGNNIPISKVISGDIPVNADGTITIPANKKYKVTLINSILTGYSVLDIKQDNVIIGGSTINYGNNNTNITSSTAFAYTELKNTDSKLALYSATSLTSTIIYHFFRVILEEIKNPVIVEYTKIKEVSNQLMSSEISQEAPIGSVLYYMGTNTPDHYLPFDGSVYNIADYVEFTEWIKTQHNGVVNIWGGDGITTFGLPSYLPFKINDGYLFSNSPATLCTMNNRTYYKTGIGDVIACVIYDSSFTMPIMISTDENALQGNANNDLTTPLWQFTTAGSFNYDGLTVYVAYMGAGFVGTVNSEGLAKRIKVSPTNPLASGTTINITSIVESAKEVLNNINARVLIKYIKYENTHYAVNQYGGFQLDTLFEGNVSVNNTVCELSYNYNEYDNIYIECSYNNVITLIPVRVASIDSTKKIGLQVLSIGSVDTTGRGSFPTHNSFKLTDSTGNIAITKIVGIKGSIPTIIEGGAL